MDFIRTAIPDVICIQPKVYGDHRGYFSETFRKDYFEAFIGTSIDFCQDNESKSAYGVLRGLHYQIPPFAQSKLVRVIKGSVLDVVVDLRKDSETFGKHVAIELTEENKKQLFVPRGFAHGFVVLSDEVIFSYKTDNYYNADAERGIAFNDPALNIDWKLDLEALKLSDKDKALSLLSEAEVFTKSEFCNG
ncbi:MAG: dTDP-4-dehydrorhamnose 3,5-epimerase [Bacteroidetes bacterium MedPE-SWsnd-G2]|nr:MAG: dTDP-4-dehydrorhamnose 3,5-epimerase [Bacteroidetes bacterium MedPE-SWsnd-G2]